MSQRNYKVRAELAEQEAKRVAQAKQKPAGEVIADAIWAGNHMEAIALALLELVKNHD